MARLVSRTVRGSAPKRFTTWGAVQSTEFVVMPASSKIFVASFSAAGLANLARSTLIRVRGLITIRSDQQVAIEEASGAFGVAVVTETARALGVTALPDPVADAAGDYWQTWQAWTAPPLMGAVASGSPSPSQMQYVIDSKGQRKLADLDAIVLMASNIHATHGAEIALQLRFLFLLS